MNIKRESNLYLSWILIDSPRMMPDPDIRVYGCLECGSLSERLTDAGRCPECLEGLVTELGGGFPASEAKATAITSDHVQSVIPSIPAINEQ